MRKRTRERGESNIGVRREVDVHTAFTAFTALCGIVHSIYTPVLWNVRMMFYLGEKPVEDIVVVGCRDQILDRKAHL